MGWIKALQSLVQPMLLGIVLRLAPWAGKQINPFACLCGIRSASPWDWCVQRQQALPLMGASRQLPALRGYPQRGGQICIAEGGLACLSTLLLQAHAAGVQILDAPGDSQGVKTIAPVVKNLSCGFWNRIATYLMASGGLEALQTLHKSQAAFLAEVVIVPSAARQLAMGGMVSQPQVLQHQAIALLDGCRNRSVLLPALQAFEPAARWGWC